MLRKSFALVLVAFCCLTASSVLAGPSKVKDGYYVKVNYTGRTQDGRVFDSSKGKKPLVFKVGEGKMLEEFEKAFIGMKKKDIKKVSIAADKAYGLVDNSKIFSVPSARLPGTVEIGETLNLKTVKGNTFVRVVHLGEDKAYLDANHYLAGKDLNFDVELLDISKSSFEI